MVLILLFFVFPFDNLILELHQKKNFYLHEGWLFKHKFKLESVPGMISKEVLAQFIINLHNELKSYFT